jgi:hypothetical protein
MPVTIFGNCNGSVTQRNKCADRGYCRAWRRGRQVGRGARVGTLTVEAAGSGSACHMRLILFQETSDVRQSPAPDAHISAVSAPEGRGS